jgi:flagellar biosynthetic protein FliP
MRAVARLWVRSWVRSCAQRCFGLVVLIVVLIVAAALPLAARTQATPASPLQGLLSGTSAPGSSAPWNIVILFTLLTLIPALVLSMTPFVRLLVVFHFLRQALGTQTTPSNQTLIGLSLILTFFLMQPVGAAIYTDAVVPLDAGKITAMAALDRSIVPMHHFMLKYAREKDLALFVELAHETRPARPEDLGMRIVAPAYLLSELQAGFRIGAALFLPFLVIDLVTAAITTSVGMMQLPPVVISTPLKILLFVVVDGWNLLIGSLMRSFA